ncbi:PAXIP1-associated glutamate-rich protein 1 [Neocloeon triangulifer]|uniref:PAXIP1-associated glutamate-rich protein 1 n=1 Tax=Neocloeon triangulifer TaxID=2078957 RepID=UPI00286F90FF|nr:PAXIP1-associated glutamate-rich protein 1 [Neocloeon triangulifer]
MSESVGRDEDWSVDCSDDERYAAKDEKSSNWIPAASEIQRMFETLEKRQVLDISWQCPGKRNPKAEEGNLVTNELEEEEEIPNNTDFDFADETATPKLRRSLDPNARGSARKKTTSLDSVLSNMRRHRQLEESDSKN